MNGKPHLLGCLYPDTGRLENRLWAYFAEVSQKQSQNWAPEIGVEAMWVSSSELHAMIMDGRFKHALHLASNWPCPHQRIFFMGQMRMGLSTQTQVSV